MKTNGPNQLNTRKTGKRYLYLALALILLASLTFSFALPKSVQAQASDQAALIFPFEDGQRWYVKQGYNTDWSHSLTYSVNGYQRYSFDLMIEGDTDGSQTYGKPVLAPVSGTIVWREDGFNSITIQSGQRSDGRYKCTMVSHQDLLISLNPIPVGKWINLGDQIGTASCKGCPPNTPNHIHLTYFTTADSNCQGGQDGMDRQGEPFHNLEGRDWPTTDPAPSYPGEWGNTIVWRGIQFTEPGVYLCEHANFMGKCRRFTTPYLNFADLGAEFCNDCVSSIKVVGNYWGILAQDEKLGGGRFEFGPSGNNAGRLSEELDLGARNLLNDQISSILVWQESIAGAVPAEGVYLCRDGWFRTSDSDNPKLCYNYPPPADTCTTYDVTNWIYPIGGSNGVTSFWFWGPYQIKAYSISNPSLAEVFGFNNAELWQPAPQSGHVFDNDVGKFELRKLMSFPTSPQSSLEEALTSLLSIGVKPVQAQESCPYSPPPPGTPASDPMQASNLLVGQNPVMGGQNNTFTFSVFNPTGSTLEIAEIWVQITLPDGGPYKAWAPVQNIASGETKTFVASGAMWGDKPGTWNITSIIYKRSDGNFFDLPAAGYTQAQSFVVQSNVPTPTPRPAPANPVLTSNIAIKNNPAPAGSTNTFTFSIKNTGGQGLGMSEIWVQMTIPDGGPYKAWAPAQNIAAGETRTFVATGTMWGDKPGTWTITGIIYKRSDGMFFDLPVNGYTIPLTFTVLAPTPPKPLQASHLVVGVSPTELGSTNTFTFDVKNDGDTTLGIAEIWVQGTIPDGGMWKGWAPIQDIPGHQTKHFVATAPMWGDKPGTWKIDKIIYKTKAGNFYDLPANGFRQSQTFINGIPAQASNLVVTNNPAAAGSDNTFTFSVRNPNNNTLSISEIWVQAKVPDGGTWKGWATPKNIGPRSTATFVAKGPMWGNLPGTWSITAIIYKRADSMFFNLPANGYKQAQTFTVSNSMVFLYTDLAHQGSSLGFTGNDSDLTNNNFDNKASSIILFSGWHALLCTGINYTGTCEQLNANDTDLRNNTIGNDTVSSIKVWK